MSQVALSLTGCDTELGGEHFVIDISPIHVSFSLGSPSLLWM